MYRNLLEKMSLVDIAKFCDELLQKSERRKLTEDEMRQLKYVVCVGGCKKMVEKWLTNMDISQKELSERLGLSTSAISDYKKGISMPSLPVFFLLASEIGEDSFAQIKEITDFAHIKEEWKKAKAKK